MSARLDLALGEIRTARQYTLRLLDTVDPASWFTFPPGGVTHIAWQVGHLAMAEYRLGIVRIREPREDDSALLPPRYLAQFGAGSRPEANAALYPAPDELRSVLDSVHAATLDELARLDDAAWDEPPLLPHPLFDTKLGSLLWLVRHEMLHAGQIGLVRRMLGSTPMW